MSVINRMLQDLEQRRSRGSGEAPVSPQVKAVAVPRTARPGRWAALSLTLAGAAGVAGWLVLESPQRQIPTPLPPRPTASRPQAPVVPAQQLPSRAAAAEVSLRLSQTLSAPPAAKTAPRAKARRRKAAPRATAKHPAAKPPGRPAAGAKTPSAAQERQGQSAAVISKHVQPLSPHMLADNDYRAAVALLRQGQRTEAAVKLRQALRRNPGQVAARGTLVGLLVDEKRYGEAMQSLREGLSANPRQSDLAMLLARLQVAQGDVPDALKTLRRTLPYATARPDYQAFLAALWQRTGRHKAATRAYLEALRLSAGGGAGPAQRALWWMGLGISLQAQGRLAEARQAFARAARSGRLSSPLQAFVQQRLQALHAPRSNR